MARNGLTDNFGFIPYESHKSPLVSEGLQKTRGQERRGAAVGTAPTPVYHTLTTLRFIGEMVGASVTS